MSIYLYLLLSLAAIAWQERPKHQLKPVVTGFVLTSWNTHDYLAWNHCEANLTCTQRSLR